MGIKSVISRILPNKAKDKIKKVLGIESVTIKSEYVVTINNLNSLSGKTVMVTGGTGAIGSAICQRLYAHGAIVGICGRDPKKLRDTINKIQNNINEVSEKSKLLPMNLDVTNTEQIHNAFCEFIGQVGKIDALINNAGGSARGESALFYDQSIEIIDQIMSLNLRGTMMCSREGAKAMVMQKSGKIINMASVVGTNGKKRMSDYAAAKSGIIGFTKSLAMELGEYGITVNCISPGMVNQVAFDAGFPPRQTNGNCLGRFGYTDEIADFVEYLISDKGDYITGQNFIIDGGRTLGLYGDN